MLWRQSYAARYESQCHNIIAHDLGVQVGSAALLPHGRKPWLLLVTFLNLHVISS